MAPDGPQLIPGGPTKRDRYRFEARGEIEVKGKGRLKTYMLVGRWGEGASSSASLG
jgi:hypothetical protein